MTEQRISDERLDEWVNDCKKGRAPNLTFISMEWAFEELQRTRKELAEMRTYSHETVRGLIDHRDAKIAALKAELADRDNHIAESYKALGDVNRSIHLFDHIHKLRDSHAELMKALEHIKTHLEIIGAGGAQYTATWHLANVAIEEARKEME